MFKVNDVIIYGTQGVCEIVDIEVKSIGGAKKAYYVLRPLKDQSSTIYAPTDNALVLKKMRRLLTVSEINTLIDSMPDEKAVWIDNVNERKECYKNLLADGLVSKSGRGNNIRYLITPLGESYIDYINLNNYKNK